MARPDLAAINPSRPIVAAVSGGADSVFLLRALFSEGLDVRVLHVHHGLREEADEDAAFVESMGAELDMPVEVARVTVKARKDVSIEMAGREQRLIAYREAMERWDAQGVALAHHADDQVETLLIRLMRGTGPRGLGGMRMVTEVDGVRLFRPLLRMRKAEILEWLEREKVPWREDASNEDRSFTRNRIRAEILPLLEQVRPGSIMSVVRSMELVRDETDATAERAREALESVRVEDGIACEGLARLALPMQRRVVQSWLSDGIGGTVSFGEVERVRCLQSGRVDLSGGRIVEVANGRLVRGVDMQLLPPIPLTRWSVPGRIEMYPWTLHAEEATGFQREHDLFEAWIRLPKDGPLWVRSRREGERVRLLGMEGTRKLQDIFVDAKIPVVRRAGWPIVCSGPEADEVVWIPGVRIAADWALGGMEQGSIHLVAATALTGR